MIRLDTVRTLLGFPEYDPEALVYLSCQDAASVLRELLIFHNSLAGSDCRLRMFAMAFLVRLNCGKDGDLRTRELSRILEQSAQRISRDLAYEYAAPMCYKFRGFRYEGLGLDIRDAEFWTTRRCAESGGHPEAT